MRTLWYAIAKQRDDVARFTAAATKAAAAVPRTDESSDHGGANPPSSPNAGSPSPAAAPLTLNAGSCEQLVARYFPDDTTWALAVAQRESHCTAGAINYEGCDTSGRTNSHAMGVFQMCAPLHEPTFAAVGCSGRYLDMECNIKAARQLYLGAGRSPWGG